MRLKIKIQRHSVSYSYQLIANAKQPTLKRALRGVLRPGRRACVLVDEGFCKARPDVVRTLKKIFPPRANLFIYVPGSESSKSFRSASQILGELIEAGYSRNDFCLAVGGGVVGDLSGFVASLFHRGMDVVHLPTTLLAMVDSSVGGKTAVNHPAGKNLIGTFHQPVRVLACLEFVRTLSNLDYQSALGEVLKYAAGYDRQFFKMLRTNAKKIRERDPAVLSKIIARSVAIKARVVGADERETAVAVGSLPRGKWSDRRILNLGHTLGHGIEKAYGMPHGLAVAVGLTMAARFSASIGVCERECYTEIAQLARELGLETDQDLKWSLSDLLPYVKRDKKTVGGVVQYVCFRSIGEAFVRPTKLKEFHALEASRDSHWD